MSKILFSLGVFLCVLGLLGLAVVIYFGFHIRKHSEANDKDKNNPIFKQLIIINYLCISLYLLVSICIYGYLCWFICILFVFICILNKVTELPNVRPDSTKYPK